MNPPNETVAGVLVLAACALIGWGLGQVVKLVMRPPSMPSGDATSPATPSGGHAEGCSCSECLEAAAWAEDAYHAGQDALHDAQRP